MKKITKWREKFRRGLEVFLSLALSVAMCTGCEKDDPEINTDKCAEIAMQYLREKYNIEFELLQGFVAGNRKVKYARIRFYVASDEPDKIGNKKKEYHVIVCPDSYDDYNGDGYYDSYAIIADDYMNTLINEYVKKSMKESLERIGIENFEVNRILAEEWTEFYGFWGFSTDFPVPDEENFSLEDTIKNYKVWIDCEMQIEKGFYSEDVKEKIENEFRPLVENDTIRINIDTYTSAGRQNIQFSVKE